MNGHSGAIRKIAPESVHQAKKRSFISGHGAVLDGKIDIFDPTIGTENSFLGQVEFIDLLGGKQGDENVNALSVDLTDLVVQPVASARTRHDGEPIPVNSADPVD
jgi:hypothetical protein